MTLPEEPQKVKSAQAHFGRSPLEIDFLVGMFIEPQGCADRSTPVARHSPRWIALAPGNEFQQASDQQQAGLVDAQVVIAVGSCLRQLAEHHELRQGCQ